MITITDGKIEYKGECLDQIVNRLAQQIKDVSIRFIYKPKRKLEINGKEFTIHQGR